MAVYEYYFQEKVESVPISNRSVGLEKLSFVNYFEPNFRITFEQIPFFQVRYRKKHCFKKMWVS